MPFHSDMNPPGTPSLSSWAFIKEALHGSQRDFTTVPLGTAILLLAIPMVLEMVMESVFAVVDVFFVSKLGPSAVATVGLTESLLVLIYTVAIGLGIGASAMVARRIGEQDPDNAATTAIQALVLGGGIAAIIGVLGASFAPDLLRMMGASTEVMDQGINYTRLMLGGNVVVMLLFLGNAVFGAPVTVRLRCARSGLQTVLISYYVRFLFLVSVSFLHLVSSVQR